jgi:hypothetical protein
MAKVSIAFRLVSRSLVACICAFVGLATAAAQCNYDVCVWTNDRVDRIDGNYVRGRIESGVTGPWAGVFFPCVQGTLQVNSVYIAILGSDMCGTYGGYIGYDFDMPSLSYYGPGTYRASGYHSATCDWPWYCPTPVSFPPYDDGWDGLDHGDLVVQRPTFTGFCCAPKHAFWNIGPDTDDHQHTWGADTYDQDVPLTFVSNCVPANVCTETPHWQLDSNNNQAMLTSDTGSTTHIRKGSAQGNCMEDSTLKVGFPDGSEVFWSDPVLVTVNSPSDLVHTDERTEPYQNGYDTFWTYELWDACGLNRLLPIDVNEDFPNGFADMNMGSGYARPPGESYPYWVGGTGPDDSGWASDHSFIDEIGQYDYVQTPAVSHDSTSAYFPPYLYNVVYLQGDHLFFAGSQTPGVGFQVYSGMIRFYQDHGDNVP